MERGEFVETCFDILLFPYSYIFLYWSCILPTVLFKMALPLFLFYKIQITLLTFSLNSELLSIHASSIDINLYVSSFISLICTLWSMLLVAVNLHNF